MLKKTLNVAIVLRIVISAFISMKIILKHDAVHYWVGKKGGGKIHVRTCMWHQYAKYAEHVTYIIKCTIITKYNDLIIVVIFF